MNDSKASIIHALAVTLVSRWVERRVSKGHCFSEVGGGGLGLWKCSLIAAVLSCLVFIISPLHCTVAILSSLSRASCVRTYAYVCYIQRVHEFACRVLKGLQSQWIPLPKKQWSEFKHLFAYFLGVCEVSERVEVHNQFKHHVSFSSLEYIFRNPQC